MFNKEALRKVLASVLRALYFGLLGVLSTFLTSLAANESLMNTAVNIGDIYVQVGVLLAAVVALIAKAVDEYIHKNKDIELNGITPKDLLGQ